MTGEPILKVRNPDPNSPDKWLEVAGSSSAGTPGPTGPTGPTGPAGTNGTNGSTGPAGPGVAAGGTTGQVLTKTSGVDYATAWQTDPLLARNLTAGTGLTGGGTLAADRTFALSNRTANTIMGNNTGSAAAPIDLTPAQVKTALSLPNITGTALITVGSTQPSTPAVGDVWVDTT